MVVSCWFNHHHVIFFGGANSHNPCCRSEISIANIVKMSKLYRAPLIVEVAVGIHQDFYRGHGMVGWMLWLFCFAGRDGFPQTRAQQMGSGWWTYSKKKSYRLSEILGVRGGHNLFALFFFVERRFAVMKSKFHEICQVKKKSHPYLRWAAMNVAQVGVVSKR